MFYPKQDIFSQSWLDIIFVGRNKQYGAYTLRRDSSKIVVTALLTASTAFVITLLLPLVKDRFFNTAVTPAPSLSIDRTHIIELLPPPRSKEELPKLPRASPAASRSNQVRMPPPVVVKADRVTEEPPSVAALQLANPGSQTIAGNIDAPIHIAIPVGLGEGSAAITESSGAGDEPFIGVEIEPMFPGGMEAFLKYVKENYKYPPQAVANGVNGKIILSFIVERDGSLTDITVIRDLKFGTGEEAVRLLKTSPKWSPGIQNGREVRVAYSLPIGLAIAP